MARVTKSTRYAEYGIEYNDGKIKAPIFGWINPLIPVGSNDKVGAAGTWSITHGNDVYKIDAVGKDTARAMAAAGLDMITGSCPYHCEHCYCDAGRMAMDNVRASNMRKYILAKMYPEFVAMAIIAQIHIDGIDQCRIHAAGDFFSNDYVDMWRAIIIMCPDVTFWTYTKVDYALKAFDDLENVTITPSMLPDNMGYNFGTCGELLDKYHTLTAAGYRVHICACGTPFEKHCAECTCGCKAVGKDCDYVFFIKHSTSDYKAGKNDPVEYAAICEVIAKQNN